MEEMEGEEGKEEESTATTRRKPHRQGGRQQPCLAPAFTRAHACAVAQHRHYTRTRSAIYRCCVVRSRSVLSHEFKVCHTVSVYSHSDFFAIVTDHWGVSVTPRGTLRAYCTFNFCRDSVTLQLNKFCISLLCA